MTRRFLLSTLSVAGIGLLCGCSTFEQDGAQTEPRHMTIPIYNSASEQEPYTRVMGMPLPDLAWARERASECEPWMMGQNGCPHRAEAHYRGTAPTTHHVVHHRPVRKKYHGS